MYTRTYNNHDNDETSNAHINYASNILVLRPICLLTLSLLTLLDSNFPGNPLWALEFHPLILRLWLSQTL